MGVCLRRAEGPFGHHANPTPNWRLKAEFSYTDGYTSEVAPGIQEWYAREMPFFRSFDQTIVTRNANRTIGDVIEDFDEYHLQQLAFVGLVLPGNREYKTNLFTSYSFSEGTFKGLTIGGGYRHQSKMPIGRFAADSTGAFAVALRSGLHACGLKRVLGNRQGRRLRLRPQNSERATTSRVTVSTRRAIVPATQPVRD